MKPSLNITTIFFTCLILLRIAINTLPIVNQNSGFLVNFGSIVLIYILIFFHYQEHKVNFRIESCIILFSLSLLSLLYSIFDFSQFLINLYGIAQEMIWFFLGFYIISNNNRRQARLILFFLTSCWVFTGITTYIGNQNFPQVSRLMTAGMLEDKETFNMYQNMNIGSFTYVYCLTLLTPILVYIKRFSLSFNLFSLLMLFGVLILIIKTEFTTALLFTFFAILLLILPQNFRRYHIFLLLIIVGLLGVTFPALFRYLAENSDSELFSERFTSLFDFASSGASGVNSESDLGYRLDAWGQSIEGFLSNPFLGTLGSGGSHSYIFDTICQYGLLGLISIIMIFRKEYNLYIRPFLKYDIAPFLYILFIFNLLLCFINTLNNIFIITFFIPLFIAAFRDDIKERKYSF